MWKVTSLSRALVAQTLEGAFIRAFGAQRQISQEGADQCPAMNRILGAGSVCAASG
jgi:hypothetical protein